MEGVDTFSPGLYRSLPELTDIGTVEVRACVKAGMKTVELKGAGKCAAEVQGISKMPVARTGLTTCVLYWPDRLPEAAFATDMRVITRL